MEYVPLDQLDRVRIGSWEHDREGGIAHVALYEALATFVADCECIGMRDARYSE